MFSGDDGDVGVGGGARGRLQLEVLRAGAAAGGVVVAVCYFVVGGGGQGGGAVGCLVVAPQGEAAAADIELDAAGGGVGPGYRARCGQADGCGQWHRCGVGVTVVVVVQFAGGTG
ncbi:hypothetical protein BACCELL_04214 [Bacteroides cellulosilyticus DSM 14838]|uniref:Uncharacterized protein n=1 Tax=Bacteroides cellulosilyticus DSM 14838 TaxID=537012 RepID=E2NIS8_9BACE|nr:hypothetical protein BACCELL_04214 [Bacteroides cellulosilyticus DSM 14838]